MELTLTIPDNVASEIQNGATTPLALEIKAMGVLLDDRAAMVEAQRHNIPTIPTFALLEQAAAQDLIDLPQAVAAMRQTSFRLPPEAEIDAMLERDRKRKQTS